MEKVYLFGASKLGIIAKENLENKYDILGFIDNDCKKWNSKFNDVMIYPPDILHYSSEKVIITSSYYMEINEQLKKYENIERIIYHPYNYEMRKFELEKIEKVNIPIETSRILLVISFYSVYIQEYIKKMGENHGIVFDILTRDKRYFQSIDMKYVNNIYYYNDYEGIKEVFTNVQYTIVHIHFMESIYVKYSSLIRKNCKRLIITYWGSDFYRKSVEERKKDYELIKKSDVITFDNKSMLEEFNKLYEEKLNRKTIIRRFGLTGLEYLDLCSCNKEKLKREKNIHTDKIVIMCGYNGKREQNHKEMLLSIDKLEKSIKEKIYLLIPMTYGILDYKYIDEIRKILDGIGIEFQILTKFMNFEEIAKNTKVVDIMLHLQTTDSLSATMLEHLYNGNIVINGKWLPYKELLDNNIKYISVEKIDDINKIIKMILVDLNRYVNKYAYNKQKVYELSSWSNNIDKWYSLYKI